MVGYRSWCATGSILGPLLFNVFLFDMFLFCNDIDFASYAEDDTPYCIETTPEEVISQRNPQNLFLNGLKITD